jgi:hypothetical protein
LPTMSIEELGDLELEDALRRQKNEEAAALI